MSSIMSITGDPAVGGVEPEATALAGPAAQTREERIAAGTSGGLATAAAIPGAELIVIEGMGHVVGRAVWPRIAEAFEQLAAAAPAATA